MSDPASKSNPAEPSEAPLDLAAFLSAETETPTSTADPAALPVPAESMPPANLPPEVLAPMPAMARLVALSSLSLQQRALAQERADAIRFDDTTSTLSFVDNALQPLAQASRRLLSETTIGEAGEIGGMA